jgi:hypothetical protein
VGRVARSRNIKPGFFANEDLAETSHAARLLFAGLWCLADREGRLEDRPRYIKGELFRFEEVDVDALLWELVGAKMIVRYSVGDARYIWIPKFKIHQNPHPSEKVSIIPPASEGIVRTHDEYVSSNENSLHAHEILLPRNADSLLLIPDSPILNPDSLIPESNTSHVSGETRTHTRANGTVKVPPCPLPLTLPIPPTPEKTTEQEGKKHLGEGESERGNLPKRRSAALVAYTSDFERFWTVYPRPIEKRNAFSCWNTRLGEGHTAAQMIAAAENYANMCQRTGTIAKHPSTFLGFRKPFEEYIDGIPEGELRQVPRASPRTNQDRNREILLQSLREDKPDGDRE